MQNVQHFTYVFDVTVIPCLVLVKQFVIETEPILRSLADGNPNGISDEVHLERAMLEDA